MRRGKVARPAEIIRDKLEDVNAAQRFDLAPAIDVAADHRLSDRVRIIVGRVDRVGRDGVIRDKRDFG